MGIFRFLLAASVVVAHSSKIPHLSLLDAGLAVHTFFIISGFYMQLILDSKYGRVPNGIRLFYTNRLLRIYPMYLLTLAFALCFYTAGSLKLGHPADRMELWVQAWKLGDFGALFLIFISQFTVVGLDITPLFNFSHTLGFFLRGYPAPPDSVLAWQFNFMPHCWSIGAELLFYSLMPLFNWCRTRWLLVLVVLAFLSRYLVIKFLPAGLSGPVNYHFGPMQVAHFLMGILVYRLIYKKFLYKKSPPVWLLALPIVVLAVLTFSPVVGSLPILRDGYLGLAALTVPILFHLTRIVSSDRWIGELSYPMYLLHIPLKWVLLAAHGISKRDEAIVSGLALLALTIVASIAMTYFIDRPLESFRRRRFEQEAQHKAPS